MEGILVDLHMEHLNKLCKTSIQGLESEKGVGKAIGVTDDLLSNFDSANNVVHVSNKNPWRKTSLQ